MSKLTRILKYIPLLFLVPLYWISFLVPKKRDLWVFGSWFGNKFADNSKYLFLYVARNHPEIRPVWLTTSSRVMDELRAQGFECHHVYGLKGFIYSMLASKTVISNGPWDINRFATGASEIVQLWHGTPLKKIGFDDNVVLRMNSRKTLPARLRELLFPFNTFERSHRYCAASEEVRGIFSTAFRVPGSKIAVTGYPRNDRLFGPEWAMWPSDSLFMDRLRSRLKFSNVFVYLPTFRGAVATTGSRAGLDLFERYGFDPASIQRLLEQLDAVLICKAHFCNSTGNADSYERIIFPEDDELPDIYPLLSETNVLLTDYSSVYFDFLLVDRPIIFTPFDLLEYVNRDRQLYHDYDSVTPGPKARDWKEVEALLREVTSKDAYRNARALVNSRFNLSADRAFSERVFESIASLPHPDKEAERA